MSTLYIGTEILKLIKSRQDKYANAIKCYDSKSKYEVRGDNNSKNVLISSKNLCLYSYNDAVVRRKRL